MSLSSLLLPVPEPKPHAGPLAYATIELNKGISALNQGMSTLTCAPHTCIALMFGFAASKALEKAYLT